MKEIPTHIDDPQLVFKWTIDEFMLAMSLIGFGFILDWLSIGALLAFFVVRTYRRHRENHARGYLEHLTYRYGLSMPKRSFSYKNAFIRYFSE